MYDRERGTFPGAEGVWGIRGTSRGAHTRSADSRVLYVQPWHVNANDGGNTGENPEEPFLTVTAALARCRDNAGDLILIPPSDDWQYGELVSTPGINETVTVNVHGVTISGMGPLGSYWHPAVAADFCLTVNGLDVTIANICFSGATTAGNGIYAAWNGGATGQWADNLAVYNCFFDDTIDTGIQMDFVWYPIIRDCMFYQCDVYGIYQAAADGDVLGARISGNFFHDVGTSAIYLDEGEDCDIYDNRFFNTDAQNAALATDSMINLVNGRANLVHHNTMSCVLPIVANGDYDDCNTASATDSWNQNYLMNGPSITNPT